MEEVIKRSLNPEQYGKLCLIANKFERKGLRKGQSWMSALYDIDVELYREVVGTDDDPFYVDTKISNFLIRIL